MIIKTIGVFLFWATGELGRMKGLESDKSSSNIGRIFYYHVSSYTQFFYI